MRRSTCVLLLTALIVGGGSALGDEESAPKPPARLTPPQAAGRILQAFESKEMDALKALAERESPDPWLVADLLCSQGAFDAAAAFARAAPRTQVDKLPAYVETQRQAEPNGRREILAAMLQALRAGSPRAGLDAADGVQGDADDVPSVRIAQGRGVLFEKLGRREECIAAYVAAAEAGLRLGWLEQAGRAYLDAGFVALEDGDWPTAEKHFRAMLDVAQRLGMPSAVASARRNLGGALRRQGRHAEALEHMKAALAIYEEFEVAADAASVSEAIGGILRERGDALGARDHYEGALRAARARKDTRTQAWTLVHLGLTYEELGDYPRALRLMKRARSIAEATGDPSLVRRALAGLGVIHRVLGDYPRALAMHEQALALAQAANDPVAVMSVLGNLGTVYAELGDHARALDYLGQALKAAEARRDPTSISTVLGNLGSVHAALEDYGQALALWHRSLEIAESTGFQAGRSLALSNIGLAYSLTGREERAREWIGKYQAYAQASRDRLAAASAEAQLAGLHDKKGEHEQAIALLRSAVRTFERLRATRHLVHYLGDLARVYLRADQADHALAAARRAMPHLETLLGGLDEEAASTARTAYVRLFERGTLAALRLGDPDEALYFLEGGRAGALLEALGGRATLRWEDLPDTLRRAEAAARTSGVMARREHARALATGSLKETRAAAQALDQAHMRQREVAGRIQREAKRQAGLFYPRAATLDEIQGWLDAETALVLYGVGAGRILALVITKQGAQLVDLGAADDLATACEALRFETTDDSAAEVERALAALRGRLVTPLSVPPKTTRILVSPVGPLSYVPFSMLFEQSSVACVPSGTTWALLREDERDSGSRVLALGDPQYGAKADPAAVELWRGGSRLVSLPGTREEARRVGDVVLLGAEASERGLRDALAQHEHWSAVHLACHGLIDPERPVLSSLALTREGDDDGFLTALEVLRMDMPADLAVLSACETAKGKVVQGEGILGLTRAFMYAGAPRVLCSLWKVDDEATRALMVKFYEVWRPTDGSARLGAGAALRKAQAHVRAQPKWKHPYYWAAWVLWGLDE